MIAEVFQEPSKHEAEIIKGLLSAAKLPGNQQLLAKREASRPVKKIRDTGGFSVENFLNIYRISTQEGKAVLMLAEALLRVPDSEISRALINDKLSDKKWGDFLFKGSFSIKTIIASFGLYFSGKFIDITNINNSLFKLIGRIGRPAFIKIIKFAVLNLSKEGGCKSLSQICYLFYTLQNFSRTVKFQTTSWSII